MNNHEYKISIAVLVNNQLVDFIGTGSDHKNAMVDLIDKVNLGAGNLALFSQKLTQTINSERKKILIIGHGRHGKDTLAEIIRTNYGFSFVSSSHFVNETEIFPKLKDVYGYKTPEECFNDRHNHREEWRELITAYNTPDKTRMTRAILERNDIYVGLRCNIEYEAVKHLFDLILWIERPDTPMEESMSIPFNPVEMKLIKNDDDFYWLEVQVQTLFNQLGIE